MNRRRHPLIVMTPAVAPTMARGASRLAAAAALRAVALVAVIGMAVLGGGGCKNSQRMSAGTSAADAVAAQVTIAVATGRSVPFRVELARSPAEREQGLMYRERLAPDTGMLFVFDRPAPLAFWMKNTFIPLDMIFIGGDRRIVGIVQNAEPRTLSTRRVEGLSQYVLEINGGLSAKLGIQPGAGVDFSGVPDL